MVKEYWVNVYKYPKLKHLVYGHSCTNRVRCDYYANEEYNNNRKRVYIIHVVMK